MALHYKRLGCHIGLLCLGVLMYADDLVLVSSSYTDMQMMVSECVQALDALDLNVNVKKSTCIKIGKGFKNHCAEVCIGESKIPWSNNMLHLAY